MPLSKPVAQLTKAGTRAYGGEAAGGLNVVQEVAVGTGIGLVFGLAWKSWHYGQKAQIEEYYANRK